MELGGHVDGAAERMEWVDLICTLKEAMNDMLGDSLDSMPPPPPPPPTSGPLLPVCHQRTTNMGAQQTPLMAAPSSSQPAQLCRETVTFSQGQSQTSMMEPHQQRKVVMNLPETNRCTEPQHANLPNTGTHVIRPRPSRPFVPNYYEIGRYNERTRAWPGSLTGPFSQGQMDAMKSHQQQKMAPDLPEAKITKEPHRPQPRYANQPFTETRVNTSEPSTFPELAFYESGRYDEWMTAQLNCLTGQFNQDQSCKDQLLPQQNLMETPVKITPSAAPATPPAAPVAPPTAPFIFPAAAAAAAPPAHPRKHVPLSGTKKEVSFSLQPAGILNGQVLFAIVPTAAVHRTSRVNTNQQDKNAEPYIKKPLNAFMLFLKEQRENLAVESLGKESQLVNKFLGEKWRSLPKEQRDRYYTEAQAVANQHARLYPEFTCKRNYGLKRKRQRTKNKASAFVRHLEGKNQPALLPALPLESPEGQSLGSPAASARASAAAPTLPQTQAADSDDEDEPRLTIVE